MELRIAKFFNQLGRGKIDALTDFLSRVLYLFIFWLVVSACALLFETEDRSKLFVALLAATIAHFAISEGIIKHGLVKIWGVRQRPYLSYPKDIVPIGRKFSDSSFPSSHMSSTLAMLTVIAYFFPSTIALSIGFTLIMSFARLHNGMHYLSDVLVGIILGIGYGMLGIYASKIIIQNIL
jgi:undecaprenyl-diphosphatase